MKIKVENLDLGNSQVIRLHQESDRKWQEVLRHMQPKPDPTVHTDNVLPLNNDLSKKLDGINL